VVEVNVRTVLTAAVIFALVMGALEDGSWWWLWLGVALWVAFKGFGLPRLMKPFLIRLFLVGLTAVAVFALAMGAREHGGWWWAWLAVAVGVLLLCSRLPLILIWVIRGLAIHRYFRHIRHDDRKNRRARRRLVRQQRRVMKRHQ
jgi:hypothetical protein